MKLLFNLCLASLILFSSCSFNNKDSQVEKLAQLSNYLIQDHNSFVTAHEKLRQEYKDFLKNDMIFNQDSSNWKYRSEHKNLRDDYKEMLDAHQAMLTEHKELIKAVDKLEFAGLSKEKLVHLSDSLYTQRMKAVENHKDFMERYNAFEDTHMELLYARRIDDH